jgi:hypothetical protein
LKDLRQNGKNKVRMGLGDSDEIFDADICSVKALLQESQVIKLENQISKA